MSICEHQKRPSLFLADIVAKVSLGDERNFPLIRFVCGDVRDLIFRPNRSRTFASVLQRIAVQDISKNPLSTM
jgi:hypothetical protein